MQEKITQTEFIRIVAGELGCPVKLVRLFLKGVEKATLKALQDGNEIQLLNGVILYSKEVEARDFVSNIDGVRYYIPAKKIPKARFTEAYKREVNNGEDNI